MLRVQRCTGTPGHPRPTYPLTYCVPDSVRTHTDGGKAAHARIAEAFGRMMVFAWCGICVNPALIMRALTGPVEAAEGALHAPEDAAAAVREMQLSEDQVNGSARLGRVAALRRAASCRVQRACLSAAPPPAALRGRPREARDTQQARHAARTDLLTPPPPPAA